MKSAEVYRICRLVLIPWFKGAGFQRLKFASLGWFKAVNEQYVTLWFQCTSSGWDLYYGSQFTLNFQWAGTPDPGVIGRHFRLPNLLTNEDCEWMRHRQNEIVADLPDPPDWYPFKLQQIDEPFTPNDNIWMRYHSEDDVRKWAQFILDRLPTAIGRFLTRCKSEFAN